MFHVKDGQSPKLHRWTLSEMVFYFLFLLLLPHCCTGIPKVIGPTQPIVANVGDDVILPCHLKPSVNAATQTVEWTRPDLKPRFVHLWRSGEELLDDQNPSYVGRTSLFISELKNGNVSLKLSRVKLSDRGTYRCFIPNINRDTTVELHLGSFSFPVIHLSKVNDGVSLDCRSKGWYPEPEVLWLDDEGRVLSAGPTETLRGPDGLFTVSLRLTVEKTTWDSFTCRIHQKKINKTQEAQTQIPVELFMDQASSAVRIIICVVVSIIPIVAVIFVMRKWGQNKKTKNQLDRARQTMTSLRQSLDLLPLMDGQRDGDQSMTVKERMKYLDNIKDKLEEKLEMTEGELRHVEEGIKTLMVQKTKLKSQREKLISLQQDDKVKIEENKKRLKYIPKTKTKDKMKKHEKTKEDLEKRLNEHEELLENTENLMESTDVMIIKMTERKGNLQKNKERINKHLKETQKQREETQRELEELEKQQAGNRRQPEQTEGEGMNPFSDDVV